MKLRKILATVSAFAIAMAAFVTVPVQAAIDGATVTLESLGYDESTGKAMVKVSATIPDTLVKRTKTDGLYNGLAIKGFTIEIPYVDGLTFDYDTTAEEGIIDSDLLSDVTDDTTEEKIKVAASFASATKAYVGELGELAILYFDVEDNTVPYDVKVATEETAINTTFYVWENTTAANGTSKKYSRSDFTVTDATIEAVTPAVTEYTITATNATVSAEKAAEGTTITVTPATAPEGQEIDTVTVNGDEITAVEGVYSFTMPAEDVAVVVTYKDIPAPEFTATATAGADLFLKKGEEKSTIKTFNCVVENCEDGIVKLYFNDNNVWEGFDLGVRGGAKVEFMTLVLNAPETLPELQISDN